MRVLIDADGCPVVDEAVRACHARGIEVVIVCDTSHHYEKQGAQTVVVSRGADSVDFALVNMVSEGDVVVTQDYGLAAMCLARGARAISQNGMLYTSGNIEALLMSRHEAKKVRMSGGRLRGPKKRTSAQDEQFLEAFVQLISDFPF